MTKVFIDGQEGTTGLRIHDRLKDRPDIQLLQIDPARRKDLSARKALLNAADVAILCLPDPAAVESVALIENEKTVVIDASTAHRTHPDWAYGFPELSRAHREKIRASRRIAVPGCHASGFLALMHPLVASGALDADALISCHSVTGYSGGGKKMIAEYESRPRADAYASPRQYALSQNHKHLKEMTAVSGLRTPPIFMPIVADFYAGMVVTVPLHIKQLAPGTSLASLLSMYEARYRSEALVRVNPAPDAATPFPANALAGRDDMEISLFGNDERIVLTARFDNLGKGASGAAVQLLNIKLSIDEGTGLSADRRIAL
jgi:N-acetyl-gamma-glutamyl-phosphate reductase